MKAFRLILGIVSAVAITVSIAAWCGVVGLHLILVGIITAAGVVLSMLGEEMI